MIDLKWIGHRFPALEVVVEEGRLRQFAKAIGETRAEYTDASAARRLGWPTIPVPPTMLFGLEMEQPNPWGYLETVGVDIATVLHGEQSFTFHKQAWAGELLTFDVTISDIYAKRGGSLQFLVKDSSVTNQAGELVADLRSVIVVRHAAEPS